MQSYWSSESTKLEQQIKRDSAVGLSENKASSDRSYVGIKSNGFIDQDYVTNGSAIGPVSMVRKFVSNHENADSKTEIMESIDGTGRKDHATLGEEQEHSVVNLCDHCGDLHFLHSPHQCKLDGNSFSELECLIANQVSSRIRRIPYQREWTKEKSPRLEELSDAVAPVRSLCPYCYNVFEHRELVIHISEHSNAPYVCDRCGMVFPSGEEFQEHEKKHGDTVLCMNCFKVCDDDIDLITHSTVRTLPVECQHCKGLFDSYCAMHSHRASCSPKKKVNNNANSMKVKCSQCPMVFATQQRLDDHFRQHTGERPFFCDHCFQTYSRKDNLNRHLRKNRIEDGLTCKCNVCQLEFPSKCSLKKHYTTEHPETFADQCMKVLCIAEPSEHVVFNGRSLRPRTQSSEPSITPESDPLTPLVQESNVQPSSAAAESIRFSCDLCSKTFGYRKSLSKHVRSVHSQDNLPHACHLCNRSFPDIKLLNRHVNWHKGAQHQCRECGICYSHSKQLLRHLKKVHAIKNTDSKMQLESNSENTTISVSDKTNSAATSDFVQLENGFVEENTRVKSEPFTMVEDMQTNLNSDLELLLGPSTQILRISNPPARRVYDTMIHRIPNTTIQRVANPTTHRVANTPSTPAKYLTYAELLILVEHAAKPYTCQVCGKPTDSKRNYLEHYMSHSKERPFKCDVCGQGFIRERRMLDHKVIHERCIKKPRLEETEESMLHVASSPPNEELSSRSHFDSFPKRQELRPPPDDSVYLARFSHLPLKMPSIHLNRFDLYPATSEGLVQSSSSMVHFRCDTCARVFSRRSALVAHQLSCTDSLQTSAEVPRARRSKPFKYLQSFEREDKIVVYGMEHTITVMNGEQQFTCGVCGRSFDKKNFIYKHTLIHVKDKPFKCAMCMNRGFMTRNSLKKHFRKCHKGLTIDREGNVVNKDNNSLVLPSVWNKSLSANNSQTSLLENRLTQGYAENHASKSPEHITVECDLDDMMTMFEPEIEIDNQNTSSTNPLATFSQSYPVHTVFIPQPIDSGHSPNDVEMPFVDNYPNFQLDDVTMNHFLESNDLDVEDAQNEGTQSANATAAEEVFLTCGQCNTSFDTKEEIFKHYIAHDVANDPIKCKTCDKEFVRRQYLQMHAMTHARPKKFHCTFCPKSFRAKRDMDDHIRTHTGEKPFACEHCDRTFRVRKQLYAHRKSHVQAFQCSKCSASFSIEWSLRRHEKVCAQENRNAISIDDDIIIKEENIIIKQEMPEEILPEMSIVENEETEMILQ